MSLSSFFGIGGGSRPATQQVIQTSKLPEEIAPFAKEVLEEAKALYGSQVDAGYTPYTGDTIAAFTPEQQQAQRALAGLYGSSDQTFSDVSKITEGLGEKFTGDIAQEYMSPYQQAVTDIEKRKAMEDFSSRIMPQFEKQAVSAGGMSGLGSRAAIQAAELGGVQAERLGDIQAKGLQRAYADAQSQFARQKERERMQASDMLKTQGARRASELQELGALSTVGEQKQALGQQALDEAYYKFLEKQAYPQEKLAEYSGFVYGNPLMSQRDVTKTSPMGQGPGLGAQLLGAGMTAGKLYSQGGGFGDGFSWAKLFGGAGGGGIASLPMVYRKENGQVARPTQKELLSRLNIPSEKFFSMTDPEKAQVLNTLNAPAEIQRALMGPYGTLARLPAAAYDVAAAPQKLIGQILGYGGRLTGILDAKSEDPLQRRLGSTSWTPAMDKVTKSLAERPVSMAELSTPSSVVAGLGGDVVDATFEKGSTQEADALRRKATAEQTAAIASQMDAPGSDETRKARPPVNPLRTVGGLRKFLEDKYAKTDELGRTQLTARESFATTADQEREAAIADRASKMRGETRRRGGIFGEDFAPAAIQQLLAVTPPGSPRRNLLERVMLGAASGSEALTKAQDEREDVMRDIEEDAGTARISATEQDLTARAANLTQKQKLDLKKLTNKFDLEKKLAELPAEEAARLRKLMLSDAEYKFKQAQIKELLAKAEKALAEAGATNRLDLDEAVKVDKLLDNQDRALTGLGIYDGKAENADVQRLRARARQYAIKAFLDNNRNTNVLASTYIAAYKKLYGDYMGKKKPVD